MAKKILLIRLSALGDVIFTLPTLKMIRSLHPEAALSWVVEDKAASLLLHRADLEEVLVYPRQPIQKAARNPLKWLHLVGILVRYVRSLRRGRYDLIYDFQGNLKSGAHLLLLRGGRKVGFARGHGKELSHLFSHERVTPPPRAVHRIEKFFSLVKPDFEKEDIERPQLFLPGESMAWAGKALEELGMGGAPPLIAHPGTSAFGAFKRWAPEKHGRLAKRLREETGIGTLVTWGPGERPLAEAVADEGGDGVLVAPPTRSLLDLAALISLGRAFLGADSGPLHLANYLGIPCVALFGPKDPAVYRPYFSPSRVVRSEVDCSPCPKRHCDDPICMKQLGVDEVYEALCRILGLAESRPG